MLPVDKYPLRLQDGRLGEMLYAQSAALDGVKNDFADFTNQMFVSTATWGLAAWEAAHGIATDVSLPLAFRRERIKSKLRGQGVTTVPMIEQVAESFSNGDVDIIEQNDIYHFYVKFVGVYGVPPNLDGLTAAINEIKPAHLSFSYIFSYITWSDFDGSESDWNEWDARELTWDAFEIFKE